MCSSRSAVRQAFTPEFLGRLDQIICFHALSDSAMEQIAKKYLRQLSQRSQAVGMQLQLPEELPGLLRGKNKGKSGARQIRRLVQEQVEGPLVSLLLRSGNKHTKVVGRIQDGQLQFQE